MPFVEILAPPREPRVRAAAARAVTDAIVTGFEVARETVTIYTLGVASEDYAHAGEVGDDGRGQRIFVKIHAFRRSLAQRAAVAASVTGAVAAAYEVEPELVAVYFLDRAPDEVAHGGRLADG